MLIVTQGCNRVYYMDSDDVIEIEDGNILLSRVAPYKDNPFKRRRFILGNYGSTERAHEVLKEVVSNLDAGGLIMP